MRSKSCYPWCLKDPTPSGQCVQSRVFRDVWKIPPPLVNAYKVVLCVMSKRSHLLWSMRTKSSYPWCLKDPTPSGRCVQGALLQVGSRSCRGQVRGSQCKAFLQKWLNVLTAKKGWPTKTDAWLGNSFGMALALTTSLNLHRRDCSNKVQWGARAVKLFDSETFESNYQALTLFATARVSWAEARKLKLVHYVMTLQSSEEVPAPLHCLCNKFPAQWKAEKAAAEKWRCSGGLERSSRGTVWHGKRKKLVTASEPWKQHASRDSFTSLQESRSMFSSMHTYKLISSQTSLHQR